MIAASIQAALVSALGVPDEDRYQLFDEYDGENFRHTSGNLGLTYIDQLLIEISLLVGRDDGLKKSIVAAIGRNLVAAGVVGGDDVFVLLSEIGHANVSFGKGLAQVGSDLAVGRLMQFPWHRQRIVRPLGR